MDIKVNDTEWTGLGSDEQKQVEDLVSGFFKDAKIVPDAATPARGLTTSAVPLSNPWCTAGCNIAQAAAIAAAALLGPIAAAVAVAAAMAAGDACRSRC